MEFVEEFTSLILLHVKSSELEFGNDEFNRFSRSLDWVSLVSLGVPFELSSSKHAVRNGHLSFSYLLNQQEMRYQLSDEYSSLWLQNWEQVSWLLLGNSFELGSSKHAINTV